MNALLEFSGAAAIVCGTIHYVALIIGTALNEWQDTQTNSIEETASPDFSAQQISSLQKDFSRILSEHPNVRHILVGENHRDLRQYKFLADYQTLKIFVEHGGRSIFNEYPVRYQKHIQAIACGLRSSFGDIVAKQRDKLDVALIHNANALGGRVIASDIKNRFLALAFRLNGVAVNTEAKFLKAIGFKRFSLWWDFNLGERFETLQRIDDRKSAKFIATACSDGVSLIIRGGGHIVTSGPETLRTNLPMSLAFCFYDPDKDRTGMLYGSIQAQSYKIGRSFNPPDYLINLKTAHIQPYPR